MPKPITVELCQYEDETDEDFVARAKTLAALGTLMLDSGMQTRVILTYRSDDDDEGDN